MDKKRVISLAQIFILILGVVAISYAIGSEVRFVSGANVFWTDGINVFEGAKAPKGIKSFNSFDEAASKISGGFYKTPPVTSKPTHGMAGEGIEKIFGKGSTAPATATGGTWGGLGYSVSGVIQGAYWGLIIYGLVQMIGPMIGLDDADTEAIALAAGWGYFAGSSALAIFGKGGVVGGQSAAFGVGSATIIGIAVAIIVYYYTYEKKSYTIVTYSCFPWDAPIGGKDCEKCNKQGALPCSEYQCRSLGQACQLLNPGTDEESCTWVNRNDVNPPVIKPLDGALLENYVYTPDKTISPPDRGVIIQNNGATDKCVKAFTPFSFGVTLNEPAKCKIDYLRKETFDEMNYYFGESSLFKYNHTQVMSLPGADTENLTLKNDGNFEIFTRCQDANGNANTATFVFKYCVEKGPDTTPPLIVKTNLLNNMPIAYDQTSIDLDVYTNEPADCKWDFLDKDYVNMNNTMICSKNIFQMNAQLLYPCSTTLTGLKNEFENKFYFRCNDSVGNANTESYEFTLIGTRALVIDSVSPDATTIKDSTDVFQVVIEVETSAGYKDGESLCYYSDTGEEDDYVMFDYEDSEWDYQHSQALWRPAGTYEYFIKCIDLGGNTDNETINFVVESDVVSPLVVRVYHEATDLKLVTNEEATCVYDTTSCSYTFEDGIKMNSINKINHYTDWDTNVNFYIKCKDSYNNKPLPDKCNIIAKPAQI